MKTIVYSWRLTPGRKVRLERIARHRKLKIAQILDIAVDDWLARQPGELADDEEQKHLHVIAKHVIGSVTSSNRRGSTTVRQTVRNAWLKSMAVEVLIDTGAILALTDKSDDWHYVCASVFSELPLPMLTSEAVLTELHMAGENRSKKESAWRFLRTGIIVLATIEHSELQHVDALMSRHRDRPMDFADATLVYLAQRESLEAIFTVDQTDFSIYRIGGKKRFSYHSHPPPRFFGVISSTHP